MHCDIKRIQVDFILVRYIPATNNNYIVLAELSAAGRQTLVILL